MTAPDRIWIAPVHEEKGPDDYYLLHPEYRQGKGTEFVRATILARLPELRGKNLACFCKPGTPCHANVLLEVANA